MSIGAPTNLGTAAGNDSLATSMSITVGSAVAAGATIIVAAQCNNGGTAVPTGVTDSKGNTYTPVDAGFILPASIYGGGRCFYSNLRTALTTSDTITVSFGSGQRTYCAAAIAVTGLGALDTANHTGNGTGTGTHSVSTGTLAVSSELVIGVMIGQNSGDLSKDAAFTALTGAAQAGAGGQMCEIVWAYKTTAATTSVTYSPSSSTGGNGWAEDIFSFKAAVQSPVTAAPGAYSLSGVAATALAGTGYLVTAATGSYALTGSDASLKAQIALLAGAYTLSGVAALTAAALNLTAGPGSYALTGSPNTPQKGKNGNAEPGSYALTGKAVTASFIDRAAAMIRRAAPALQKLRTSDPTLDL